MSEKTIERVSSGISGLDEVLQGGFLRSGVYIIIGPPGAGKTILANQIAFEHVKRGGRVLYVSLLAESHARMFAHMSELAFFDESQVAESMHYVSGYQALESEGLSGLLALLRRELRERKATMLVLDGLVSAEAFAESPIMIKKFVHELQTLVSLMGCTAFLLTSGSDVSMRQPEHTMVDGLLELTNATIGVRQMRTLEVKKFRGSFHLGGLHALDITSRGVTIYPRLEARVTAKPSAPRENPRRCPSGIAELDKMFGGGIDEGAPTLVLGPAGSGKTLASLAFLEAGLKRGERAIYFGFHESPQRLLSKGHRVGIDLFSYQQSGALDVVWHPNVDFLADALVGDLLRRLAESGATRLVIDSISGLKSSILIEERMSRFLSAFSNELRLKDVTTYFVEETRQLFSPGVEVPVTGLSAIVDNILFMRQVELSSHLVRVAAVLKTREYAHASELRTFEITSNGFRFAHSLANAQAILTGSAQLTPASATKKRKRR